MSLGITETQYYTDIADAIRAKNGSADTYTPSEMATAITDLPTPQTVTKGLVFSDYDSDGYPHKAEFVGSWTEIPTDYCYYMFFATGATKNIDSITIPTTVNLIGNNCFNYCTSLESVTFPTAVEVSLGFRSFFSCSKLKQITIIGNVKTGGQAQIFRLCSALQSATFGGDIDSIANTMFNGCTNIESYDFSHCTTIPSLYSTTSLDHKNGCVIKVPQSLLSTWQNSTNWIDLQNVVWQGV